MVDIYWSWDLLAQSASKLREVEKKLTNEQLEYLNRYYKINKMPHPRELQSICTEWNINDPFFFVDLEDWFCGRRMAEKALQQRLRVERKVGA